MNEYKNGAMICKVLGLCFGGLAAKMFISAGHNETKANIEAKVKEEKARKERSFQRDGIEIDPDDI